MAAETAIAIIILGIAMVIAYMISRLEKEYAFLKFLFFVAFFGFFLLGLNFARIIAEDNALGAGIEKTINVAYIVVIAILLLSIALTLIYFTVGIITKLRDVEHQKKEDVDYENEVI